MKRFIAVAGLLLAFTLTAVPARAAGSPSCFTPVKEES